MPLGPWPGGRVDQIALITPDLQPAMDAYVATVGVRFHVFEVDERNSSFSGSSARFRTRIAVAPAGLTAIELIQPISGKTIHSEHLRTRGPGLHHIGIYVDSLADAIKILRRRGYQKLMQGKIDRLGHFAYFEANDMHCIVEALQFSIESPLFLADQAKVYP
jgi:methylmalonyl-CoA/ethylmalonyl-CoA epimerase